MPAVRRVAAVAALSLAALGAVPLSASLVGAASAAAGQISATGTWVYPGELKVTTTGTPSAPYSSTHSTSWRVYALPPSTPCPTALFGAGSIDDDDAVVAEGAPTGATFSQTDQQSDGGRAFPDTAALHLCAVMQEADNSTGPDGSPNPTTYPVTGLSDTPVAAHVPDYRVVGGWGQEFRKVRVHVQCADAWPGDKLTVVACDLRGTMKMTISTKGKKKLGLSSTSIGHATISYDPKERGYYSYLTTAKAVAKALPKWDNKGYAGTMTVHVTSPVEMTRVGKIHSPFDLYGFNSATPGVFASSG